MKRKSEGVLFAVALLFSFKVEFACAEEGAYFQNVTLQSPKTLEALNVYQPKDSEDEDGWRPLTEEEFSEKTVEVSFKIAAATAELLDSLHLSYASKGLYNIIEAGDKVRGYQEKLEQDHYLNFEIQEDRAALVYRLPF